MADFRTHISFSTIIGFGYGAAGHWYFGLEPDTSMLGACLCSVAGMLPDLDSASGRPIRESLAFGAAVVPMLLIDRFQQLGLPPATMVLAGTLVYLLIRFGLGWILKNYTVHRGMFHSFPALAIVAIVGYLVTGSAALHVRYFHAGALALGYLSHLVLDEIYSVDVLGTRIKRSFGTALKLYDGRRIDHSIAMAVATVALLVVTPPTRTFFDGMTSSDMWSGLRQRLLPPDNKWFGITGDVTAFASRKPAAPLPEQANAPAKDGGAAAAPIATGSLPAAGERPTPAPSARP